MCTHMCVLYIFTALPHVLLWGLRLRCFPEGGGEVLGRQKYHMSAVHTHMRLRRLFVLLKKMWVCVNRLEQGCHMCSGLVITALPVLTAGDTLIASAQPACLLVRVAPPGRRVTTICHPGIGGRLSNFFLSSVSARRRQMKGRGGW